MIWLKSNWRWGALNLFAGSVLVYVLSQGTTGWSDLDTFDSGLESGKWAIRFLLTSLSMTPLNTYFGWKGGLKLRKSAGLWAFGFAAVHVWFYLREARLDWLTVSMPFFLLLGLVGLTILTLLACTSNRWAMKSLGKNWKRLHRLVYGAGAAVAIHALLATTMSKKLYVRDPDAASELKIYVAVVAILLAVRLPIVRDVLQQIPVWLRVGWSKVLSIPIHRTGEELPRVDGRESGVSIQPTFVIPNTPAAHLPSADAEEASDRDVSNASGEIEYPQSEVV